MPNDESTCWTLIKAAADGSPADREALATRYLGVVRAYLAARWRTSPLRDELDDATQAVFLECFRQGGVLEAASAGRVTSFRAFLYGVVRNVARRFESQPDRAAAALPADLIANDESQSRLFDREWARSIMVEAAQHQRQQAEARGEAALQRVELLRLRFEEGLPLREIARLWNLPAPALHHAYAQARQEFKAALVEVVSFHHPGTPAEVEQEAAGLLSALT